jgi:predicted PurR-regulated permease PerM
LKLGEHFIIRFLYYLILISIFGFVAYSLIILFIPILIAYIFAYFFIPFVNFIERQGLNKSFAAFLILIINSIFIVFVIDYSHGIISENWDNFKTTKTEYISSIKSKIKITKNYLSNYIEEDIIESTEKQVIEKIYKTKNDIKSNIPIYIQDIFSIISTSVTVLIFMFLFIIFGSDIKKFTISLIPNRYFEMSLMILYKTNMLVGGYVRGLILDCIINGALYAFFLSMMGVKGGILLGIIAGLLNAIPYAGPLMGAVPPLLVVLIDTEPTVPWWSIPLLFTVVHLIDNVLIYPNTVGKGLKLHPLVVIFGIFAGGAFGGILGMLVAVPIIGIAKEIFFIMHTSLKSYKIIDYN